jgi:protein TonB
VILRLIPALLLGLGISAGLYWLMYAMLQHQTDPGGREPLTQIDFVRLQRKAEPPETLVRELPPPPPAEPPPPPPDAAIAPSATQPSATAPAFDMPKLALPVGAGNIGAPVTGIADWSSLNFMAPEAPRDNLPGGQTAALGAIVRVPPMYPLEARRKKLEGWVKLEFTVTEDGTVTDIKVRAASPPGIFDQAAANAIGQWKFRPAMDQGKPVRKRAMQTLKFELDKAG